MYKGNKFAARARQMALVAACCCMGATSCTKEPQKDARTQTREAAETYYNNLLNGEYDKFADGISTGGVTLGSATPDSLSKAYRQQLAEASCQYIETEMKRKGGLASFKIVGDVVQPDSCSGYVCIEVAFGDSTHEEIALPLVRTKQGWKMQ